MQETAADGPRPANRLADATFVALVTAASLAPYVTRLGFYGDDWDVLSLFTLSPDRSLGGLYRALAGESQMLMRPGQKLLGALLYSAFGLHPLGYHAVNAALLVAAPVLLLLVLRELGLSRPTAVSVATVYAFLPHYSTARVWFASIQSPFSMTTYLLSLYAGLRSLRTTPPRARGWQALSLGLVLASTLAYEVALPLFVLNAVLFGHQSRQLRRSDESAARGPRLFIGATVALVLAVAAFKAATSTRLSGGPSLFYLAFTAKQLARINLWVYGFAAPRSLFIAIRHASPAALGGAVLLALAVWGYVLRISPGPAAEGVRPGLWLRISGLGIAVFLLAHAVFLTTNVGFSATGANNRTAIAGAVGIALVAVAVAGRVAGLVPVPWRRRCFAGLIGAGSSGAALVNATLVSAWVTAYAREQAVLDGIHRTFATLPSGTTVILDGVCRYVGPAIVFESSWDLQGALRIAYRDSTLHADVVSPDLRVEPDGLHTVVYGTDSRYPYDRLVIFDARRGTRYQIPDASAARAYFARISPARSKGCPPGHPGHGVRVF